MEEEKTNEGTNGFGNKTYWNRPTGGRTRKLPTRYPSLKPRISNKKQSNRSETATGSRTKSRTPSRSPSPTLSHVSLSNVFSRADPDASTRQRPYSRPKVEPLIPPISTDDEKDSKDEKSIVKLMKSTLPQFSNETDWEMAIFELGLMAP